MAVFTLKPGLQPLGQQLTFEEKDELIREALQNGSVGLGKAAPNPLRYKKVNGKKVLVIEPFPQNELLTHDPDIDCSALVALQYDDRETGLLEETIEERLKAIINKALSRNQS